MSARYFLDTNVLVYPHDRREPKRGHAAITVLATSAVIRRAVARGVYAVANLADLAGKVSVTLRAESQKGFDRSKLQNGVLEPLKEADLIE